jgi:diguanylate cyclase (GGDEF)-like protein/PAS domain S-box-containing protein
MQFNTLSSILFISGLICANVMIVLWRRRKIRGAKWLSLVMLSMSIWGIAAAFEMSVDLIDARILFAKIQYFGIVSSSPLLVMFAYNHFHFHNYDEVEKNGDHRFLTFNKWIPALWIIPAVTILLVWTNEGHNMVWTGYRIISTETANITVFSHGLWFWVFLTYTYMLIALSIFILVLTAMRMWKTSRQQALTLLFSLPLPIIANSFYIFFPDQFMGIDLTPVGFAFTGIILAIGIYNFQLLDLTPFAREILLEFLPEAVIVVDKQNRILDLNAAFTKLLGNTQHLQPGDRIDHLLAGWLPAEDVNSVSGQYQITIKNEQENGTYFEYNHSRKTFELSITPFEYKGKHSGRMMILSDITERIANEDLLFETNEKLNAQLVEIHILKDQIEELAVRDALTGLYNRRFLNETLSREFSRAGREHYTISVAMIDVDFFKKYNDTFGHQAGDEVLVRLARHLLENVRDGDVVVRFGGEEFIILLPFATTDTACSRINSLRQSFSHIRHRSDDMNGVTFSAGIASYPQHGGGFDEVIKAADKALYCAKQAGRNQVKVIEMEPGNSDLA